MGWSEWKNLGSDLIDLGTNTSFNVSSYEGYEKFTVDNFLIKTLSNTEISKLGNMSGSATAAQNYVTLTSTMKLIKQYDSSTGLLTCYIEHYAYSRSANSNSDVVILTDTKKSPVNVLLIV